MDVDKDEDAHDDSEEEEKEVGTSVLLSLQPLSTYVN